MLVVEVTEKPIDVLARFDNRGTKARGPYQFLVAPTFNNLSGTHEAFTVRLRRHDADRGIAVRRVQLPPCADQRGPDRVRQRELQPGDVPGTPQLRELDYKTRSTIVEAGVYYPVIRTREANLTVTSFAYMSDNYSFTNLDMVRPVPGRPAARHPRPGRRRCRRQA